MIALGREEDEGFSRERQEAGEEDQVLDGKECGLPCIWFGEQQKLPGPLSFLCGRAWQDLLAKVSPL